jgi:hypothetical protein
VERAVQGEANRDVYGEVQPRHRDQQDAEAGERQEMQPVAKAIQEIRP